MKLELAYEFFRLKVLNWSVKFRMENSMKHDLWLKDKKIGAENETYYRNLKLDTQL